MQIPLAFKALFTPTRYKLFYGGRGGAKSWAFARSLLIQAIQNPIRILCCREFQTSIKQSVHQLLKEQIDVLGFNPYFTVQEQTIKGINGSEFLFMGLARNIQGIKSTENISIAWVEEAQTISQASLELLIPTIRSQDSELWFSWNPWRENAPIEKLKDALADQPNAVIRKVGWQDNPWFPDTLDKERRRMLIQNRGAYDHIWEGHFQTYSEALVFKNRVLFEPFNSPQSAHFYYGVDWGFSQDPTALVRCFIQDGCLYIDYEAVALKVEIDEITALFDRVPGVRQWPIRADSARPETISHMARRGFKIKGAKKWSGSVADGITYLQSFSRIIVHPRCCATAEEFRRYSYIVDRQTGDILPRVEDANNHCIDALRYALEGLITHKPQAPLFNKAMLKKI